MGRNMKLAEALYKQVYELSTTGDKRSARAAEAAVKLAIIYVDQGRLDLAEPYYRTAIDIGKASKQSGADITELIVSLQDLFDSYIRYEEKHRKDIKFEQKARFVGYALAVAENFLPPIRVVAALDDYYQLYVDHKDYAQAKTSAEKMLSLSQQLRRDPLETALCLQRLARCYGFLNDTRKQNEMENAALAAIRHRLKGDEGATRRQLASGYQRLKDCKSALKNIEKALAIDMKAHGEPSTPVADDLSNKLDIVMHCNSIKNAEPIARKVIAMRHKMPQENHFALLRDMKNLEQILRIMNRNKEADEVKMKYQKMRGDDELLGPIMRDLGMPSR